MDWVILGGLGALVGIVLWVMGKKGTPANPPSDGEGNLGAEPPYEPPPLGTVKKPAAPERSDGPTTPPRTTTPPEPSMPPIVVGPIPKTPDVPGATPQTAVGSRSVFKGFVGFIQVEEPDSMSALASRLGTTHNELRDHPANAWAKERCPQWVKRDYNNGRDTIALLPRYGKTVGYDCIAAPGYQAALYGTYTGQHCILFWGPQEGWN